jgi:hypothetical protein
MSNLIDTTNYAIDKQVDCIEFVSTCYGNIYLTDEEIEILKSFLIELLELRLEEKYKINKDIEKYLY